MTAEPARIELFSSSALAGAGGACGNGPSLRVRYETAQGESYQGPTILSARKVMQRLLGISLLTALVFAATERPAQAWVNSRFSIGLNWSFQSGGNSAFWGLWRNGQ